MIIQAEHLAELEWFNQPSTHSLLASHGLYLDHIDVHTKTAHIVTIDEYCKSCDEFLEWVAQQDNPLNPPECPTTHSDQEKAPDIKLTL
jgi:hypothetical protein